MGNFIKHAFHVGIDRKNVLKETSVRTAGEKKYARNVEEARFVPITAKEVSVSIVKAGRSVNTRK